jgi:hypothetical protein
MYAAGAIKTVVITYMQWNFRHPQQIKLCDQLRPHALHMLAPRAALTLLSACRTYRAVYRHLSLNVI